MKRSSPFRPSFGASPPTVAGRSIDVARIADALDDGPGASARASLFVGPRGIGKTVALNEVEAEARQRGWVLINDTVSKGLLDRIVNEQVPELWRQVAGVATPTPADERPRRRMAGFSIPVVGGVDFEIEHPDELRGLRPNLTALTDVMGARGAGVMVTLDEVHRSTADSDLAQIATTVQHLVRENRQIAFICAGLPASIQNLLGEDGLTFLRRAMRFPLAALNEFETSDALGMPVQAAGRRFESAALENAVRASRGYPYLVQAIGQHAWERRPDAEVISEADVHAAIPRALADLHVNVHQVAVNDLSPRDRDYLRAMLADGGSSETGAINQRLGVNASYGSRYRHRLLVAGMIEAPTRGRVRFAFPYLREYLETVID